MSQLLAKDIDFKRLFKSFNRGKKRKLTTSDKQLLTALIKTQANMFALTKALEVGSYPPSNLKQGSPLMVEPLEATLKLVTFSDKKLKLWKNKKGNKNGKRKRRKKV